RIAADDVGERAAAIDPEVPRARGAFRLNAAFRHEPPPCRRRHLRAKQSIHRATSDERIASSLRSSQWRADLTNVGNLSINYRQSKQGKHGEVSGVAPGAARRRSDRLFGASRRGG